MIPHRPVLWTLTIALAVGLLVVGALTGLIPLLIASLVVGCAAALFV